MNDTINEQTEAVSQVAEAKERSGEEAINFFIKSSNDFIFIEKMSEDLHC